ncbi:MAG: hypothetical protein PV340_03410 [Wolbachia sp.]|nr:hypothetical protein [Wolbachia sp.]MDD9336462.1 hypothetical protein [Wolbachia sp.]
MAQFNQCRLGRGIITGTIDTASLAVTSYLVYVLLIIEGMAVLPVAIRAGLDAIATLVF